jgi:SAM-dependent methyltransferase
VFANRGLLSKFDLLVASHSYEHVFKPIQSLIEAAKMLRSGGVLVLFVPDGFSDEPAARNEPTHTLYIVPDMIK